MNLWINEVFGKKYPIFCMGLLGMLWVCIYLSTINSIFAIVGFIALILNSIYIFYKVIVYLIRRKRNQII